MAEKRFKYYDVYNQIKKDVIAGKYPTGSMLPTENELMEIYGASKTTIRHATKLLSEEKYIEAKQGCGTMVLEFSNYRSRPKYKDRTMVDVRLLTEGQGHATNVGGYIELLPADEAVAQKLGIDRGEDVFRIECLHLIDGRAYGYNISYLRADMFRGLEQLKFRPATDFYQYLMDHYGLKIVEIKDIYGVANLERQYAIQLGLEPGSAVMKISRYGMSESGSFMYGESYVRTDIYEMSVVIDQEYLKMDI